MLPIPKISRWQVLLMYLLMSFCLGSCASGKDKVVKVDSTRRDSQVQKPQRQKIVEYARNFEDKPYKRNGRDERGFDCSGFVCFVFKNFNIELPSTSSDIASDGRTVSLNDSKPGDLILFGDKNRISHVGIISSHSKNKLMVIHSSSSQGVIEENVLASDYWLKRIRVIKDAESFNSNKLALKRSR